MYSDDFIYSLIASLGAGFYLVSLAVAIATLVGMWKIFTKAGKPGWGIIVPFYNLYCLFDIAFGNGWLFLLMFVPCVGAIFYIICLFKLAKAFGQGVGFGFGLLFLNAIFIMILGFGSAEYVGPQ